LPETHSSAHGGRAADPEEKIVKQFVRSAARDDILPQFRYYLIEQKVPLSRCVFSLPGGGDPRGGFL
jgi:hypothetical protein